MMPLTVVDFGWIRHKVGVSRDIRSADAYIQIAVLIRGEYISRTAGLT